MYISHVLAQNRSFRQNLINFDTLDTLLDKMYLVLVARIHNG